MEKREERSLINSGPLVCFCFFVFVAGFGVVSMGRDVRVHGVVNGRTATALDASSQTATEVSLAMDIVHLACIAMYDEVASSEGAVLDSLVSDMERDRNAVECPCEVARAVECRESDRLALICHGMRYVSLDGSCYACQIAGEAESFLHRDLGCMIVHGWT